jgi:hypothetical protein
MQSMHAKSFKLYQIFIKQKTLNQLFLLTSLKFLLNAGFVSQFLSEETIAQNKIESTPALIL